MEFMQKFAVSLCASALAGGVTLYFKLNVMVANLLGIAAGNQSLLGIALIIVGVTGLLTFAALHFWSRGKSPEKEDGKERIDVRRSKWEQELHKLRFDRREFWRLITTARQNWQQNPDPGRSIDDLVRSAEWPKDLPLEDNTQFSRWALEVTKHWNGDTKKLGAFVSQIYIPVTPGKAIKSQTMEMTREFDRFDTIRMEMSKFWDHWGRQEPLEEVIREQKADGLIKGHREEIKLLTFLEIARSNLAQTGADGKYGLFSLGRRNAQGEE